MGVFDEVKCDYELPWPEAKDFGYAWQSKCTPAQYCDLYDIRADGTLWHHAYDSRFEDDKDSFFGFVMRQDNKRLEQVLYTGELEIHHLIQDPHTWYSVQFWFRDGIVRDCVTSKTHRQPDGTYVEA